MLRGFWFSRGCCVFGLIDRSIGVCCFGVVSMDVERELWLWRWLLFTGVNELGN